jgi:protein-S-isoprenylcysteine O-methyltransferase Ste14
MKPDYVVALIIFLTAFLIRTGYEILKKTGRINPKNTILFIFIFITMCLLLISCFYMCPHDPLLIALPGVIRWTGLAIIAIGLILAFGALIQLRGVENIDHLVTTGLFARLRHPMYMGFILWIFGWAIYNGAGASMLAGFIAVGNIMYWGHLEERHLAETYGDKYIEYRKQTWF